ELNVPYTGTCHLYSKKTNEEVLRISSAKSSSGPGFNITLLYASSFLSPKISLVTKRPNNSKRHLTLVKWLVDKFGVSRLKRGSGGLDVAGGKGKVAFGLTARRGIPCTVIDPRQTKLTADQLRFLERKEKLEGKR